MENKLWIIILIIILTGCVNFQEVELPTKECSFNMKGGEVRSFWLEGNCSIKIKNNESQKVKWLDVG